MRLEVDSSQSFQMRMQTGCHLDFSLWGLEHRTQESLQGLRAEELWAGSSLKGKNKQKEEIHLAAFSPQLKVDLLWDTPGLAGSPRPRRRQRGPWEEELRNQTLQPNSGVWIPALPLTTSVISGKLLSPCLSSLSMYFRVLVLDKRTNYSRSLRTMTGMW